MQKAPVGTPKLPGLLKYPPMLGIDTQEIFNIYSYLLEPYPLEGISLVIYRVPKDDKLYIIVGDWNQKQIDLKSKDPKAPLALQVVNQFGTLLAQTMALIKLDQAQFFISTNGKSLPLLCDIQTSINKYLGPGMIRDLFGKVLPVPTVRKLEVVDRRVMDAIKAKTGSYSDHLFIKPSVFRMVGRNGTMTPLYVRTDA